MSFVDIVMLREDTLRRYEENIPRNKARIYNITQLPTKVVGYDNLDYVYSNLGEITFRHIRGGEPKVFYSGGCNAHASVCTTRYRREVFCIALNGVVYRRYFYVEVGLGLKSNPVLKVLHKDISEYLLPVRVTKYLASVLRFNSKRK